MHLVIDWVYQKLSKRLDQKKQNVNRLRWQAAQMERILREHSTLDDTKTK